MKKFTYAIITFGILAGLLLTSLSIHFTAGTIFNVIFLNIGCGLIATAFISMILDFFWSKERAKAEKEELQPLLDKFESFLDRLIKIEGRLEAFKQLGLNYCHPSRKKALGNFLNYANEVVNIPKNKINNPECVECRGTVNIVSSSARGLMGYLDREANELQKEWRNLITTNPKNFRILLTHPAYSHLRQPAEERSSGDIELEILKTAIFLYCVAGMDENELRLYRGSPTVFSIQVNNHILLNPYPYGKMAMDTLCLEFESVQDNSYVDQFVSMHFNHTWEFIHQDCKRVDGDSLVCGINSFDDILKAFSECTFVNSPKELRLTGYQIKELDTFTCKTIRERQKAFVNEPPDDNPFLRFVQDKGFTCCQEPGSANVRAQLDLNCNIAQSE